MYGHQAQPICKKQKTRFLEVFQGTFCFFKDNMSWPLVSKNQVAIL